MAKRILWVRTGGTIDMIYDEVNQSYVPAPKDRIRVVLERISLSNVKLDIRDDVVEFIDSSEMIPEIWARLSSFIASNIEDYDGVLVTHGTDTMHYTASALSFMLRNLNKPVVLTGSMIPIVEENTDGIRNLLDSIAFLTKASIPGVFLVFNGRIIRGVRARKVSSGDLNAFASINSEYIGFVENGELSLDLAQEPKPDGASEGRVYADTLFDERVFIIKLFPGIPSNIFEALLDLNIKGVVIESFGSGGARVTEPGSIVDGIKALTERRVPVFVTSQCSLRGVVNFGPKPYYVAKRLMEAGAVSLRDMLTETAIVKLMWVLGHTKEYDEIIRLMLSNIAGEIALE